jgi:hypothetical protein
MRIMTVAMVLAGFALSQAAPARSAAADYPPAFPRAGASQLLDNAWGAVWDVIYPPGQPTPMHRRQFDFVGVELADSSVTTTTPEGVRKDFPTKHGESYFLPRGTTHIEETPAGSPPRHAVIIDLKDGVPAAAAPERTPVSVFPGEAAQKVTESPRVVLWDYAWPARPRKVGAVLTRNTFIVIVDGGGELTGVGPDGKPQVQSVAAGQVLFRPAGATLSEAATKGAVRAIVVELK